MRAEPLADGKVKYVEEFKHPITGKRKRVSVTYAKDTKKNQQLAYKELILKIEEKKKELLEGTGDSFQPITLKELSDKFLKDKEYLKGSTQFVYKDNMKALLSTLNPNLDVSHLAISELNSLILKCRSKTQVKYLKTLLDWGQDNYFINTISEKPFKNEFKKISKKESKNNVEKKLYYELDEIDSILSKLKEKDTYLRELSCCLIIFLLNTGVRIGEALAITYEDISDDMILTINKTVFNYDIQQPKTPSSHREIAINKETLDCIQELNAVKEKYFIPKSKIIFCNKNGTILSYKNISQALRKCLGDNFCGFHIFRHTHASILAEKQIPLDTIQRRLGHEKDDITKKIYIHVTDKTREREHDIFRNMSMR